MAQESVTAPSSDRTENQMPKLFEPSFGTALPHYLPLGVFPLLFVALYYGDWWLIGPFLFMSLAAPGDKALGEDGRNLSLQGASERKLLWHNLPVWSWALLWPPTLIFGLWQMLIANAFPLWQDVIVAILLTMEAQAVFVVGHELVHRRTTWERRLGEFLLASASYPQYATEHVYIHHAQVGTPGDIGSAPKGVSFWVYFPREVASNITNSWKVIRQKLARQRRPVWHYSNPFWRYGLGLLFWYGLVFWMGGILAVLVYILLGFGCVFSMKLSNYFQHYGLRRVRLPNGRWEKAQPRHSWSADWKFSNWMFFNMQRHADHHAMVSRQYPLLQIRGADESPQLPGTYGDMMNLVLRPKKWFAKMDPLVDQWRQHFYPEIDDWSPYDSALSATRPESFDAIIDIYGTAPRLARRIERNPELLDNLQAREFTDLDLPRGFGPDSASEAIARRGLTRLYWTHEMSVPELRELIDELPAVDAKELAEVLRDWLNDKAFQIGMHVIRSNLSPTESSVALTNLADATVATIADAVLKDYTERFGALTGDFAIYFLGDLASKETYAGIPMNVLITHGRLKADQANRLARRIRSNLQKMTRESLLFASMEDTLGQCPAVAVEELPAYFTELQEEIPSLSRARCIYQCGEGELQQRFEEVRTKFLDQPQWREPLIATLNQTLTNPIEVNAATYRQRPGGLMDMERAARLLQLAASSTAKHDLAPSAVALFRGSSRPALERAAVLWRELQAIQALIGESDFNPETAAPRVQALIAQACGCEDYAELNTKVAEVADESVAELKALLQAA